MTEPDDKIRCDACPVMCYIRPGMTGACDRYANEDGELVRVDPHVLLDRDARARAARRRRSSMRRTTGAARSSAAPRLRHRASAPAPPIPTTSRRPSSSPSKVDGVDMVTVVTEGIYQLLRRQGEDRHRPPSRRRMRDRCAPRASRSAMSRPANTARRCCRSAASTISPAAARKRAASPARPCWSSATASRSNSTVDGGASVDRRGRQAADHQRQARSSACASAAARRRSACSPGNGATRSTRSSSSTITSPACCPSIRPASCSARATPASG